MALSDDINRILRDHEKYTGNGGNGALPVGDTSSARKPIDKRDLRVLLMTIAQTMGDPGALQEILDEMDGKAALTGSGKMLQSRAAAVSLGQAGLPSALGMISTREGNYIVVRSPTASADDPLFATNPRWGVIMRLPASGLLDNKADQSALRRLGAVPLTNIAGTANSITADIQSQLGFTTLVVGQTVVFTPTSTNTGPTTITINGSEYSILPSTGTASALPAQTIRSGRPYQYRVVASATPGSPGSLRPVTTAMTDIPGFSAGMRDNGLIQLVSVAGTANDVTAQMVASAVEMGVSPSWTITVKFTAVATNTGEMTLTVAGDTTRALLDGNGQAMNAGAVRLGRSYTCRRQGDNWRVDTGGVSLRDVQLATRAAGISQLTVTGGTVNAVQAEVFPVPGIASLGVASGSFVVFTPIGTNTGPMTLHVAGDQVRDIRRDNSAALEPGEIVIGRSYVLRLRGTGVWQVINLGSSYNEFLNSAVYRMVATGTGNAINLAYPGTMPKIPFDNFGLISFAPSSSNTAPNPTITMPDPTTGNPVVRTLYDVNGAVLPAGAIRWRQTYIARIRDASSAWLVTGPGWSDIGNVDLGPVWTGINSKASQAAVNALSATVAGKADQADLDDLETVVEGLLSGTRVVGDWDAASGAFPVTRPNADPIEGGDQWNVTGAGTVDGVDFGEGDVLTAIVDGGGVAYAGNWSRRAGTATHATQVETTTPGRFVQAVLDSLILKVEQGQWHLADYLHPDDLAAAYVGDIASQDEARVTAAMQLFNDDWMTWWQGGNGRVCDVSMAGLNIAMNDEMFSENFAQMLWDMGWSHSRNRLYLDLSGLNITLKNWLTKARPRSSGFYAVQGITDPVPTVVFRWEQSVPVAHTPRTTGQMFIWGERNWETDPIGVKVQYAGSFLLDAISTQELMNTGLFVESLFNSTLSNVDLTSTGYQVTEYGGSGFIPDAARFSNVGAVVTASQPVFDSSHEGKQFGLNGAGQLKFSYRQMAWSTIASVNSPTQITLAVAPSIDVSEQYASFEGIKGSVTVGSNFLHLSGIVDEDLTGQYITVCGCGQEGVTSERGLLTARVVEHAGNTIIMSHRPRQTISGAAVVIAPSMFFCRSADASVGEHTVSTNDDVTFVNLRIENTYRIGSVCAIISGTSVDFGPGSKFHGRAVTSNTASQNFANNCGTNFANCIYDFASGVRMHGNIFTYGGWSPSFGRHCLYGKRIYLDITGDEVDFHGSDTTAAIYNGIEANPVSARLYYGISRSGDHLPSQPIVRLGPEALPGQVRSWNSIRSPKAGLGRGELPTYLEDLILEGSLRVRTVPASPSGLPSGSVWQDAAAGNVLKIVP